MEEKNQKKISYIVVEDNLFKPLFSLIFMEKNFILFSLFLLINVSFVSATLSISDVKGVYNLGETIIATLTINPSSVAGDFEYSLNCGEEKETIIFYKGAENYFEAGKEIKLNTKIVLERDYIRNLTGECYLKLSLGSESFSSPRFKISNKIKVDKKLDKYSYDPGEAIVLEISAIKENGEKLNGFVKVNGIVSFEKEIKDGFLKEVLSTKENQEAGDFPLEIFVYDLGKDKKINNFENATLNLKINQIPYSVPLTLSSLEVKPGEELKYEVNIFDQSGKEMKGLVNIEFVSPDKKKIIKRNVEAGNSDSIKIELNETPGRWVLASSFGKIREEREINVLKLAKLDFDFFENSSIILIKNIGNDVYSGNVTFNIGNETKNLDLTILPGEERRFTLSGPGEQNVKISAGEDSIEKKLLLTGKVVDVKEVKKYFVITDYPLVWSFIAVLLILLVITVFFRYKNKTIPFGRKIKEKLNNSEKKDSFINVKKENNSAEASLVMEGTREPSTIVILEIKNKISNSSLEKLKTIVKELNKYNSAIEFRDNEIILVFSPKKTKSFKNEYNAIKYSYEISKAIEELNKKFSEKIEFGIGISSGDLISKIENGKLNYTNVDNSLSFGRKIAKNFSNNNVVISEKVKNKLLREVRTEKIEKDGNTYYVVKRISDKEENEAKLKDLLNRMNISSHD